MSRLPFLFIVTGIAGFALFHGASLMSLSAWIGEGLRGPTGWFHIHLFVLGWATMLAMGAVYQLINVILQSNLYSERLGFVHYVCFTAGLAGLLYGFLQGNVYMIAAFATAALMGIVLFAWNVGATLWRASQWNAVTISVACAMGYLVLTGLSGLSMGVHFVWGDWPELHERLFGAHIWLGTLGWFGLLITGFSYKMLPMFYLSHQYPTRLQNAVLLLWNAAVLGGAASFLGDLGVWTKLLALLLLVLAIVIYNIHLLQIRRSRHKRNPGSGIRWSMLGNQVFAAAACLMLLYSLWFPQHLLDAKFVLLSGWIYLGGWVSFTILGYASKIVPFLWWTHRYGKTAGKPGTPVMSDLLDDTKVNVGLAAVFCAGLLLTAGLLLDSQSLIAIGGVAFSVSSLAYIGLIGYVFAR
ncbi:hypothetical protein PAESOLCIP111_04265 [Paenibacillus solanacearum]|uniref:Cbb3-type cytochrome c oxidase subunit I n=1 Tax=Paenibacillus solanacearum TaxID=2048548 RepID=A0A916K7T9_9BACL|nr:hypothetical protein [Paenibacillus solanacearum]CAG7641751.1 hypothetical protein PAESOLCIP111_04265 [Paenibacillus solanacearum]